MIYTLSTQLARAKRSHQPLLFVRVTTIEIAVAAVRAAEHAERAIVLVIDATHPLLYSLEYISRAVLELASQSKATVSVEVEVGPNHIAAEQALHLGVQAVTPKLEGMSEAQAVSTFNWISRLAIAKGVEIILDLSDVKKQKHELATAVLASAHCVAIRDLVLDSQKRVDAEYVKHLSLHHKLPILASEEKYSTTQLRRFASLHLSGPMIHQEAEEAFTAGLRAALHHREHFQPRYYLPKAQLAVEEHLIRTYELLCSK